MHRDFDTIPGWSRHSSGLQQLWCPDPTPDFIARHDVPSAPRTSHFAIAGCDNSGIPASRTNNLNIIARCRIISKHHTFGKAQSGRALQNVARQTSCAIPLQPASTPDFSPKTQVENLAEPTVERRSAQNPVKI
jgi:hypothetical protein